MDSVDFIKLNFADAEATIRAYDTKSQIVLASTALSFNPILSAVRQLDVSAQLNLRLGVLFVLFTIVMILFALVLAPASGANATGGPTAGLFFLRRPADFEPRQYLDALAAADLRLEYANEVLALHRVRLIKNRRFKRALYALIGYLGVVLAYAAYLTVRAIA
ncbi:MAG: hypothetical protein KGM42_00850 [Hyphomicrobiales bacterium]|nr:hypothetical protein [Hyphomicrobiales bacterium]